MQLFMLNYFFLQNERTAADVEFSLYSDDGDIVGEMDRDNLKWIEDFDLIEWIRK